MFKAVLPISSTALYCCVGFAQVICQPYVFIQSEENKFNGRGFSLSHDVNRFCVVAVSRKLRGFEQRCLDSWQGELGSGGVSPAGLERTASLWRGVTEGQDPLICTGIFL